jgi:hypothetical protein
LQAKEAKCCFILKAGKGSRILNLLQKEAKEVKYWIYSRSRQKKQNTEFILKVGKRTKNTGFIAEGGKGSKILDLF